MISATFVCVEAMDAFNVIKAGLVEEKQIFYDQENFYYCFVSIFETCVPATLFKRCNSSTMFVYNWVS